jgi:hypothetical protein
MVHTLFVPERFQLGRRRLSCQTVEGVSHSRNRGREQQPSGPSVLRHFPEELLGRVPAVYLKSAEETILAVLPFIRISNLRGVRDTALFNSRRRHHCKRIHFSPTLLYARPLAPDRSESVSRGRLPIFKMVNDTLSGTRRRVRDSAGRPALQRRRRNSRRAQLARA